MIASMTPAPASTGLDWDDLRIALAIAESGTLSGAAISLHISHPTLSRRLQRMERRLGTRLFERMPIGLRPTTAGEEVRELALRLRDDIAALERHIGGRDEGNVGTVRLTAPDAVSEYLLPNVLRTLCSTHPQLQIDLLVSNDVLPLARRTADIALRVTSKPAESLRGRQVGAVAMAVYASRQLLPRDRQALPGAPWIGFDASLACSGPGVWLARNVPESAVRFRANTLLGAAQAVKSGIGFGVLPCFVGQSLAGVDQVGEPISELSQPLWLLMHADTASIPRVRAASAALAAEIKKASGLLTGYGSSERDQAAQHA
ncbi:LysR family transcriptional regulator [Aquincola sp. S2]|uniref:LysR family transcriptional regulator n=2 Tax=Pseudaquabacterium terrae TaxID=2732868 RepID=A0ABX2E936_9BURK|nr:LysR family transcriptional regulator [Aquabacterium terrae]